MYLVAVKECFGSRHCDIRARYQPGFVHYNSTSHGHKHRVADPIHPTLNEPNICMWEISHISAYIYRLQHPQEQELEIHPAILQLG